MREKRGRTQTSDGNKDARAGMTTGGKEVTAEEWEDYDRGLQNGRTQDSYQHGDNECSTQKRPRTSTMHLVDDGGQRGEPHQEEGDYGRPHEQKGDRRRPRKR